MGPQVPVAPVEPVAVPVGPQVPAAAVAAPVVQPLRLTTGGESAAAAGPLLSRKAIVAAADAQPLRPLGGGTAVSRPAADSKPEPIHLASALPGLATTTAQAVGDTPELPLGIAAVVVLFLLLQNRIDRRDPKLALARIEDDEPLEFSETGPVHLRLVSAA
ncbi:MAG: hypothetical protein WD794_14555 [Mycobacteriales bacterium]